MNRRMLRPFGAVSLALTCLLALPGTVLAGPPLLCVPFEIGAARSLPWSGAMWRDVETDYDINRLTDDTLALLTPETPVIVRMETLRRAAVYAVWAAVDREVGYKVSDLRVANDLQGRLIARAREAKGKGRLEALALFDAGYLAETYRQAVADSRKLDLTHDIDGYAWVERAISLLGGEPEMEFAAAIITTHPRRTSHERHLRKAVSAAHEGSLLARNLVKHFGRQGTTLAALRAQVGGR